MSEDTPQNQDEQEQKVIHTLDEKIKQAQKQSLEPTSASQESKNMSEGMRIAMEFSVTIGVSIFLGYSLDKHFETAPLFLFLLMVLGFMAGVWNMYRVQNNYGRAGIPYSTEEESNQDEQKETEK